MLPCPLCRQFAPSFHVDRRRAYHQCPRCELVFADPLSHLTPSAEKAVYDLHENDPEDAGYRKFLGRLAAPLLARLAPGMEGLDYGSGPGPALAGVLSDAGMSVALYDPFYAPDTGQLSLQYDFFTCTEVVEHFRRPAEDWERLAALVRPGGWLGVMTQPSGETRRVQSSSTKVARERLGTEVRRWKIHRERWQRSRLDNGMGVDREQKNCSLLAAPTRHPGSGKLFRASCRKIPGTKKPPAPWGADGANV